MNLNSNLTVATTEAALDPAQLGTARRISTIALPWSAANAPMPFGGQLVEGGVLSTTNVLAYNDQSTTPSCIPFTRITTTWTRYFQPSFPKVRSRTR